MPTSKARCDALTVDTIKQMCKDKGFVGYSKLDKDELVIECCLDDFTKAFRRTTNRTQGTTTDIIKGSVESLLLSNVLPRNAPCTIKMPKSIDFIEREKLYDDFFTVIDGNGNDIDDVNFTASTSIDPSRPIADVTIHTNEKQIDAIQKKCRR